MSKKLGKQGLFGNFKQDLPASLVVFFVALPLCLGIAFASGAPLFSGLLAGIVGGIVVGSLSGSQLGVSGPAAGLAVIVLAAIQDLGFEIFLVAVILAGVIQVAAGFIRAGVIAYYFPSSVIYGMLSGIGIIIFMKQIPHAFGYDKDPEGDFEFFQMDGQNTFSELINMLDFVNPTVMIITGVSLFILLLWETKAVKKMKFTQLVPGPLVAVVAGVLLKMLFDDMSGWELTSEHLVSVPVSTSLDGFFKNFTTPESKNLILALNNSKVYYTAAVIAIVASLETLLCVEAADKLDPLKRVTPTNRELKAQGVGNIVSGLIGGLPITQVIVRSSANVQAGGKSKLSAIIHGVLIIVSVLLIPAFLNLIPLATLAAILLIVGFKLIKPTIFAKMFREGAGQFVPFIVTVLGIVFIDLLYGLAIGLGIAFLILKNNYKTPYTVEKTSASGPDLVTITLGEKVTFLNKSSLSKILLVISSGSKVVIDGTNNNYIHNDISEIISDFKASVVDRNIELKIIEVPSVK